MSLSKMLYSFICAGLLTFNNTAHATVYDFGNIQASESAPFSQLPLSAIDFDTRLAQVKHHTLAEDDWGKWNVSGLSDSDLTHLLSVAQDIDGYISTTAAAPSTSSAPEPESYAMILAGLGLIVFTARHRK